MNPELLASVAVPLPKGRMITSDEGDGDMQPLWLSDTPASAELWAHLCAEHSASGPWFFPCRHGADFGRQHTRAPGGGDAVTLGSALLVPAHSSACCVPYLAAAEAAYALQYADRRTACGVIPKRRIHL